MNTGRVCETDRGVQLRSVHLPARAPPTRTLTLLRVAICILLAPCRRRTRQHRRVLRIALLLATNTLGVREVINRQRSARRTSAASPRARDPAAPEAATQASKGAVAAAEAAATDAACAEARSE